MSRYGAIGTITYNTDVEVVISDILDMIDLDDILDYVGVEAAQEYVENHGGFTLEDVSVEDLQGALEAKGVKPNFPAPITDAINVLFDYFNSEGTLGARVA